MLLPRNHGDVISTLPYVAQTCKRKSAPFKENEKVKISEFAKKILRKS